jgi:hypothetical protein
LLLHFPMLMLMSHPELTAVLRRCEPSTSYD